MAEISAANQTEFDKRYRTTALIVGVQILVTLGLIAAAFFVSRTNNVSATPQAITSLWIIIFLIAVGTIILRRSLFGWERLKKIFLTKGTEALLQTLQTNTILLGLLADIISIIGFLIAVLSDKWDMFRAGVIAAAVFLAIFPRRAQWKKVLARLETSRGI